MGLKVKLKIPVLKIPVRNLVARICIIYYIPKYFLTLLREWADNLAYLLLGDHSPLPVQYLLVVAFDLSNIGKFTFFSKGEGICNHLLIVGFQLVCHLAILPRVTDCSAYYLVVSADWGICYEIRFDYHNLKILGLKILCHYLDWLCVARYVPEARLIYTFHLLFQVHSVRVDFLVGRADYHLCLWALQKQGSEFLCFHRAKNLHSPTLSRLEGLRAVRVLPNGT